MTFVDVAMNWLSWFHFLILGEGPLVILICRMIFLSPFLNVKMSMSKVSFLVLPDQGILYMQNDFL